MKQLAKCLYCGKEFDRNEESYVAIGKRYAHLSCAQTAPTWTDDTYKDKIFQYMKGVYGSYDFFPMDRSRQKYINEHNYTNFGIYQTLIYAYEILRLDPIKSNGRIGIVPYLYEDAKKYFDKFYSMQKNVYEAANAQLESMPRIIIIEKTTVTRKREFSLDDIKVEE